MAMEGTHVRFARDLAKVLGITDRAAYYAGAVYPDSRYASRIARTETHGETSPHDPFAQGLSDFERGWATHLLYDRLSSKTHQEVLGQHLPEQWKEESWNWAVHTARKLIEEIHSCEALAEEVSILREIQPFACPRGEKQEVMDMYYGQLRSAYIRPMHIASATETLQQWGVQSESVVRLAEVSYWIIDRSEITSHIRETYDNVLQSICPLRHT